MRVSDGMPASESHSRRIKFGLVATVGALLLLIYPGFLVLPINALAVLLPPGCRNGFALLILVPTLAINMILMTVGVAAVVSAAQRAEAGLVVAILIDVTIATLFLIPSLTFSWTLADRSSVYTSALTALLAVIPLAAAILLLEPRAYASKRTFQATLVASGVVLAPGLAGVIAFGLELTGLISLPTPIYGCA
jgi:hypothetical protein